LIWTCAPSLINDTTSLRSPIFTSNSNESSKEEVEVKIGDLKLVVSLINDGAQVQIKLENQTYSTWSCVFKTLEIGEKTDRQIKGWQGLKNFFEKVKAKETAFSLQIEEGSNQCRILKCFYPHALDGESEFRFTLEDVKVEENYRFDTTLQDLKLENAEHKKEIQDLKLENAEHKKEIQDMKLENAEHKKEIQILLSAASVIKTTIVVDSTRRQYEIDKSIFSFGVNKIEKDTILLIDVLLCVHGQQAAETTGIISYGSTKASNYVNSNYARQIPLKAVILGHQTTGVQTLELKWVQGTPFIIINPNSQDHSNFGTHQTCSIITISEIRQ